MLTQDNRSISISTPFGKDKLLLERFTYEESLNGDFEIEATLVAPDKELSFDKIVGEPVSISMSLDKGDKPRFFHGVVARFMQQGREPGLARYNAIIWPWFKFLEYTTDCQIFQNESVPDIVSNVFKKFGYTDFELQLSESYKSLEFCVQYRESTWNFISRLLEKEGIAYYFRHEEHRHVMVMTDAVNKHKPTPSYEKIPYRESDTADTLLGAISSWEVSRNARTGVYAHTDFDFKKPSLDLRATTPISRSHGMSKFEEFDYPGSYVEEPDGKRLSKIHIQSIQVRHDIFTGESTARGLAVGSLFTLTDHNRPDQNREYLISRVALTFNSGSFSSALAGGSGQDVLVVFACSFDAIQSAEQYRPTRRTNKRLIVGPQTAIVTGPAGEEIHTDEHGRVKVHFHWDRYGKFDNDSSCWVRVSQLWAGKGWGGMHLPRVGQEVIVEFLEGDPDRPIITGRVYNGIETPPYALPANKNISTIKSESTKGGGGFNEVKMDDTKGKELLYIQAEKDKEVRVKHDRVEWVGNESHLIVKKDQFEQVEGSKHLTVSGDQNEKIDGGVSLKIGGDLQQNIGGKHALDVSQQIHLKAGTTLVIEAGTSITLKAGGAFITIGPAGVAISGTPVLINSGGSAGSGSGCAPEAAKPPREPGKPEADKAADSGKAAAPSPAAGALKQASQDGAPFCEPCEGPARA